MNRRYSPEMRERALRMLTESRGGHPNLKTAILHMAVLLGMSPETLRLWPRRYEVHAGVKPGVKAKPAQPDLAGPGSQSERNPGRCSSLQLRSLASSCNTQDRTVKSEGRVKNSFA